MTEVETYDTVKSPTLYGHIAEYFYLNALAAKEIVLADKSGSYTKPDHRLAQFITKYQAEHKPKKGEAKYTYSKVTTKEDEGTGLMVTNREIVPVRAFFNQQNADLKHFLEFFLVQLCTEYSVFYPTQKGKLVPAASFEKQFSERVEKELPGTVTRFIFTIGNVMRVDAMVTETVIAPELAIMKEMEGYYGTQEKRPSEQLRVIVASYLKFCKLLAIFLANSLVECTAAIALEDLLAILRHFNTMQRAEGNGAQLNNCVFDEIAVYVKSRRTAKAKKGEAEVDTGMQDDLTEEITGEKPVAPKATTKPAAIKGTSKKGGAKKPTGKAPKKQAATKPAAAVEDEFEDSAAGTVDDLDELDS